MPYPFRLSAAALLLALASLPAFAQAQSPTTDQAQPTAEGRSINGNPVSQAQLADIEDWCAELVAQQGATGTQSPETTMPADAANATADATSATSPGSDNAPIAIDVQTITLEMCQAGGFAATPAN